MTGLGYQDSELFNAFSLRAVTVKHLLVAVQPSLVILTEYSPFTMGV